MPLFSPAEAFDRLASPYALEDFSVLTGEALLAVDLRGSERVPEKKILADFKARIAQLACPCIAVVSRKPGKMAAALLPCFDVALGPDDDAAAVCDAIESWPLASMALVQLLRQGQRLNLHNALIAESLVYSTLQAGPEFARWLAARRAPQPEVSNLEPAVLVARDGKRMTLTLNRPAKRNAFSAEMRDALCEALLLVAADSSIKEVAISGAGPAFCSGGDLDEFGTLADPATAHAIRSTRNAARLLAECAGRCTVSLHGACVGAGIELASFAGKVHAAPDAYFELPEIRMGLVPGAGGTAGLSRRIGRHRTAYMALSGTRIDARTHGKLDATTHGS